MLDVRELALARQEDEIQARESFNSDRLRAAEERSLRASMKRGLSADASPDDLHLNDVEPLNPVYTQRSFRAVMRALHETALGLGRATNLCAITEIDRAGLERHIVEQAGLEPGDVSAIIGDLLFTFDPKQGGEQFLIEVESGRVAVMPLLVVERSHFASDYASISKAPYPAPYGAYHKALTRTLEDQVGAALRALAPQAWEPASQR